MQSFGYALAMNLLWCWSHWCLEEESRMKSSVLESLFALRIYQYIGVILETTDIKHLYFGTKWPWTLASQNSRHCTVQSLGSPRTGPRSFAVLVLFVLRCWSERSQEQLNQLLSTWMLFFCSFLRRIDTKMIRRQKWLILMDVSRSCWTCSWPSLNFVNPKAGTTGSCLNTNKIGHPWIDRNQAFNNLEPRTRDSRKDHVDFASVIHLLILLILEYPDIVTCPHQPSSMVGEANVPLWVCDLGWWKNHTRKSCQNAHILILILNPLGEFGTPIFYFDHFKSLPFLIFQEPPWLGVGSIHRQCPRFTAGCDLGKFPFEMGFAKKCCGNDQKQMPEMLRCS